MNRSLYWVLLSLSAALAQAQQRDSSEIEIKSSPIRGSVYLLRGDGGNIAASAGSDGIAVVDDDVTPLAAKVSAALQALGAPKPVRFVINTHFHADHTGGNLALANQGATLISHDNLRKRLAEGSASGNGGSMKFPSPPAEPGAVPVVTFDHELTLHLNGEEIRVRHYPAAHTDGDSIVFFTKANVVHMGDIFVRYGLPFVDVDAGGSIQGMIRACEDVIRTSSADVKIIPGHGDLATLADLRQYVKLLKDTDAAIAAAIKAGKTLQQMKQEKTLAPWVKGPPGFVNADTFTEIIYYSHTRA